MDRPRTPPIPSDGGSSTIISLFDKGAEIESATAIADAAGLLISYSFGSNVGAAVAECENGLGFAAREDSAIRRIMNAVVASLVWNDALGSA